MLNDICEIEYGKVGGDCTCPYYITLIKECTVGEFIEEQLKDKGEWGYFGIRKKGAIFGDPMCEYHYGKITTEPFPEDILNSKIKKVSGGGGWSRSDFIFEI